jgi:hypothetical protein
MLYVFYQGTYYRYDNGLLENEGWSDPTNFLHFVNRIANPLLPISGYDPETLKPTGKATMLEYEDFLDLDKEPNEIPAEFFNGKPPPMSKIYHESVYTTRIILLVFDQEE